MPDIKYVCLSDMHLGAQNSLLSNLTTDCSDTDPRVASPVLVQLVECLKSLIAQNENAEKPILILNGDILELALTTDNEGTADYWLTRIDARNGSPKIADLARVPFHGRSLAFDGEHFWTNHREAHEIVSFARPGGQA